MTDDWLWFLKNGNRRYRLRPSHPSDAPQLPPDPYTIVYRDGQSLGFAMFGNLAGLPEDNDGALSVAFALVEMLCDAGFGERI